MHSPAQRQVSRKLSICGFTRAQGCVCIFLCVSRALQLRGPCALHRCSHEPHVLLCVCACAYACACVRGSGPLEVTCIRCVDVFSVRQTHASGLTPLLFCASTCVRPNSSSPQRQRRHGTPVALIAVLTLRLARCGRNAT